MIKSLTMRAAHLHASCRARPSAARLVRGVVGARIGKTSKTIKTG
ncbi:MAG: hypothetical protein ABI920_06470 [Casimicrobiaceae bacterium]